MDYPKYVRVSQNLLNYFTKTPDFETLNLFAFAQDKLGEFQACWSEQPLAKWGTGVYEVGESGELKLVASNFDTSG